MTSDVLLFHVVSSWILTGLLFSLEWPWNPEIHDEMTLMPGRCLAVWMWTTYFCRVFEISKVPGCFFGTEQVPQQLAARAKLLKCWQQLSQVSGSLLSLVAVHALRISLCGLSPDCDLAAFDAVGLCDVGWWCVEICQCFSTHQILFEGHETICLHTWLSCWIQDDTSVFGDLHKCPPITTTSIHWSIRWEPYH